MGDVIGFIYNTGSSTWLRMAGWVIPTVQTIHILALAVLVGSALMLDLRLAGILARADGAAAVARRYLPSSWAALAVLLASGFLLLWAEPDRVLSNQTFWIKMALVLLAFLLTFVLRARLIGEGGPRPGDRALGWIALAIWIAALFCGRWIAYTF